MAWESATAAKCLFLLHSDAIKPVRYSTLSSFAEETCDKIKAATGNRCYSDRNSPCTGDDDERVLPVLRALRIELVLQRIPIRHVSIPIRHVPLRVRRFASCKCRNIAEEPRSFSALTLEGGMAPELAYVTAKLAAPALLRRLPICLRKCCPWAAPSTAARCPIEHAASASISRGCIPRESQIPTLTR